MKRKTFEVSRFVNDCNSQLRRQDVSDDFRKGMISILEHVLHSTDNYNGFNYVEWMEGGSSRWNEDGRPEDNSNYLGNQTRRYYFPPTFAGKVHDLLRTKR